MYGLLNPKHQKFKKSPQSPFQVMRILFLETLLNIFAKDTNLNSFVLLNAVVVLLNVVGGRKEHNEA